jgi:hypothetical protein
MENNVDEDAYHHQVRTVLIGFGQVYGKVIPEIGNHREDIDHAEIDRKNPELFRGVDPP